MSPHSPLLTLYDSKLQCVGFVLFRGRSGFEAYNTDTKSIGIFATKQAAIATAFEVAK